MVLTMRLAPCPLRSLTSGMYKAPLFYRDEIITTMTAYVNRQFRKGTTHFSVFADQNQIKVEISCHNFNFKNFWGGEFLSTWNVDLQSDSISG